MNIRHTLAFAAIFLAAGLSGALAADRITVAYSHFPPLAGARADHPGEKGLLVEMYNQVLPTLGYEPVIKKYPLNRIIEMLDKGQGVDLYTCTDTERASRAQYAFGPQFLQLNIELYQIGTEPELRSYEALRDSVVLKQFGFDGKQFAIGGEGKRLDQSNRLIYAPVQSIAPMLARGRTKYVIGFRERLKPLFDSQPNLGPYRSYRIGKIYGYLCLHNRLKDADRRVAEIHAALVAFQETPEGLDLLQKYNFSDRFGGPFSH